VREEHLCENHARITLTSGFFPPVGRLRTASMLEGPKQFDIDMIIISEVNEQQVVYLREVSGEQRIPILIGLFEATSLDRRVKAYEAPRPLTHDAMAMVIRALDGVVQDVVIDTLEEHTYHAKVRIRQGSRLLVVDLRPSDAFAMALAFDAPVFFADEVLELVGRCL
jgi:bifunctional DNase/RNase